MAYIGSGVSKTSDIKSVTFATSTTGSGPFALGWAPDSEASTIVTINGVKQHSSSFTLSGANLTITETLVAGDELEVVGIVHVGGTFIPLDGSITTTKLADGLISAAKLADNAVTKRHIASDIETSGSHTISISDSYDITAADVADHNHTWIQVDSSGSTDPLEITMPTPIQLEGKFVTIWVIRYDKEITIYGNTPSGGGGSTDLLAVSDHVTWTSHRTEAETGIQRSAEYLKTMFNNVITVSGGPPVG